jgi:dual specificity phosphatase 12
MSSERQEEDKTNQALASTCTVLDSYLYYNFLTLDYLLLDIRNEEDYRVDHIRGAHHVPITTTNYSQLHQSIIADYGFPENRDKVLLYGDINDPTSYNITQLIALISQIQDSQDVQKPRVEICLLKHGFTAFQACYPFLCISSPHCRDSFLLPLPNQITETLFLGSAHAATPAVLNLLGIQRVLAVVDRALPVLPNIERLHINTIPDANDANLGQFLPQCVAFLQQAAADGVKCLVHCQQGVSRSATVVLAFLMRAHHLSYEQAFTHTRTCRHIRPNEGFVTQLRLFEEHVKQQE